MSESPHGSRAWLVQVWRQIAAAPAWGLILIVRMYQRVISPLLGPNCRYQPTCSHYMIQAVKKYGALRGGLKGIWRILRCHPFSRGGYDPP